MGYVGVSHTLLGWLGDVVSDSGHSKHSVLVSFLGDVPKAVLVSFSKVVIRPHLVFVGLSLEALTSIPFVGLDLHSEHPVGRELWLPQVHTFPQLVVLLVKVILKVALHKHSFGHRLTVGFGSHNLLHLLVDWVLFDSAEPEV
jgi:hypothetical protein